MAAYFSTEDDGTHRLRVRAVPGAKKPGVAGRYGDRLKVRVSAAPENGKANKAIELLDAAGVSATLVDLYSLPFDTDKLMDLIGDNNGYAISIEDNYGGGIGSAIADALVGSGDAFTLEQMHVRRIPKSARTPDEIMSMCALTADDIVKKVMSLLQVA